MIDIHAAIAALGVEVIYTNDLPPQRLGAYLDDEKRILIRASLHGALETETLAHEYIHAKYGDRTRHPTVEGRAWREAAAIIISEADYAAAEQICDNPAYIARELGTTLRIVESYRQALSTGRTRKAA